MMYILCNMLLSKSCCLEIVFPNSLSLFIMMFYHMYWKLNLYWWYWQTVEDVYHSSAMSHHSYSQTLPNIANECLHNYSQPLSRTTQNTNAEVSVICALCILRIPPSMSYLSYETLGLTASGMLIRCTSFDFWTHCFTCWQCFFSWNIPYHTSSQGVASI